MAKHIQSPHHQTEKQRKNLGHALVDALIQYQDDIEYNPTDSFLKNYEKGSRKKIEKCNNILHLWTFKTPIFMTP